ncbi:MAG: hypothetical protein RI885_1167 [Actinomycetota bacterium]
MIRVLVVDDQSIIRAGLATMLGAEPDIEVVGTSADGADAVADAARLDPDVILMDIRMPRLDGVEATRRIRAEGRSAVVLVTTFDDEEYLLSGIAAGASGFLLKDAGADLLAAAVRSAQRGDALIDPAMTRALLAPRLAASHPPGRGDPGVSEPPARNALLGSLSDRELEILGALARGLSNAEIATELFVSGATVKTHISNVLSKTGTSTRVQAAVFAYEVGFVRPGWLGAHDR